MTTTGSIHFTDQDHHELHFVTKDSDGKVYPEYFGQSGSQKAAKGNDEQL